MVTTQSMHGLDQETTAQIAELAEDVMGECRKELMMRFRFLSTALWRMPHVADAGIPPIATDGAHLFFEPLGVVSLYRADPNYVIRTYLHSILHCIFRHPFDKGAYSAETVSLVYDILVESVALEMCEQRFFVQGDEKRREVIDDLRTRFDGLSVNKLCRSISATLSRTLDEGVEAMSAEEIFTYQVLFEFDSHHKWRVNGARQARSDGDTEQGEAGDAPEGRIPDELDDASFFDRARDEREASETDELLAPGEDGSSDVCGADPDAADPGPDGDPADPAGDDPDDLPLDDGDGPDAKSLDSPDDARDTSTQGTQTADEGGPGAQSGKNPSRPAPPPPRDGSDDPEDKNRQEWEEISKQIEMELATHAKTWGEEAGVLAAVLQTVNRKRYDYADFLRKFSVLTEDMKVNDDEFDYIYYTYGLDLFGDMPLVEPLEYTDALRVREFAVVIDTSGSCSGALVTHFVERTYDILKETEAFASEVNIHIIQADARVQSDAKIAHDWELEEYLQDLKLYGFGGTDFRPAFEYVDSLVEQGEFENLRGLIYFTDGMGTYPDKKPAYDAAFVFVGDTMPSVAVPPWAMKVVLDEDDVREL